MPAARASGAHVHWYAARRVAGGSHFRRGLNEMANGIFSIKIALERMALPCRTPFFPTWCARGSEEHTSELQSLMRNSYAVYCFYKKTVNDKKYEVNLVLTLLND